MTQRVIAALLLALCTLGCGGGSKRSELAEFVDPALDRVEPAVRTVLERALDTVRGLAEKPEVADGELGAAYGDLGRLYHAYEIYDSALPCYLNAQTLMPNDHPWPYYLGQLYRSINDGEAARAALERARELKPRDGPTLVALAHCHRDAGRAEEAARLAEDVFARNPKAATALLLMGDLSMDRGDFAEAVERYERLLQLQPRATSVYHRLALAYRNLGRVEKAEECNQARGEGRVVPSDPLMKVLADLASGSKALLNQGSAAFSAGDFAAAERALRKAVEISPEDIDARLNLGSALVRLGRLDEALEQYREVLARDPRHATAHFNLGVVLANQGAEAESMSHYEEALRIEPDNRNPRFNLANMQRRAGDCDAALSHYQRLVQVDPGNGQFRAGEAACLMQLGRFEPALQRLEEGLDVLPQNRTLAMATARLLAACPDDRFRDGDRAYGLAERLVQGERSPVSLEVLAMALAEVGRYEQSIRFQDEAITLAERGGHLQLLERLNRNRESYERSEPCRDPAVD